MHYNNFNHNLFSIETFYVKRIQIHLNAHEHRGQTHNRHWICKTSSRSNRQSETTEQLSKYETKINKQPHPNAII